MTTTTDATLPAALTTGTWTIDTSHSAATFTVRHAGISKAHGSVAISAGSITIGEELGGSSVTATLDPSTIDTRDANRDNHLRSGDFFDVETHPEWTFVSTEIRAEGEGYVIVGDLTLRGTTRQVALETEFNGAATDPFGASRIGFSASTEISRKDFGLTWNAALETGGVLVGDKVKIRLEVEAVAAA